MARQTDDPHIMAIIFATKLGTNSQLTRHLQDFFFPFQIAPAMPAGRAVRNQTVQIMGRGGFDCFQIIFC